MIHCDNTECTCRGEVLIFGGNESMILCTTCLSAVQETLRFLDIHLQIQATCVEDPIEREMMYLGRSEERAQDANA